MTVPMRWLLLPLIVWLTAWVGFYLGGAIGMVLSLLTGIHIEPVMGFVAAVVAVATAYGAAPSRRLGAAFVTLAVGAVWAWRVIDTPFRYVKLAKPGLPGYEKGNSLNSWDSYEPIVATYLGAALTFVACVLVERWRRHAYLEAPDPRNAPGDFFVAADACLLCTAPEHEAPDLIRTEEDGCYFFKQPTTEAELDRATRAVFVACCDAVRYVGKDPRVLQQLAELESGDHQAEAGPKEVPDTTRRPTEDRNDSGPSGS